MSSAAARRRPFALPAAVALHLAATAASMGLRPEHVAADALLVGLWLAGGRARRLGAALLPFWITGVVYDAFRLLEPWRGPVRVAEPYLLERAWFAMSTPAGPEVPAIALQAHATPALDLVCGLAYVLYLLLPLALAAVWSLGGDETRVRRLGWSFFAVNVAGLATHLVYPVAPPWYVARYGLELVAKVPPEAAGALRFDALLGVPYFSRFYARSPDVFGALPSLHVAYPVLCLAAAWTLGAAWRRSLGAFSLLVGAAAVYLGHHYVVDVLAGIAYAVAAWALVVASDRMRARARALARARSCAAAADARCSAEGESG